MYIVTSVVMSKDNEVCGRNINTYKICANVHYLSNFGTARCYLARIKPSVGRVDKSCQVCCPEYPNLTRPKHYHTWYDNNTLQLYIKI